MRNAFVNTLFEIAKTNPNMIVMTGDLGFGVLTDFWEKLPEQFMNVGISEQNMASAAAGMALEGKDIITYSIGNFPTLRCLEQIRNDICYHNANVKIIAVGGGFAYGSAGMSHHATEDLAVMRALPNMRVFAPADRMEAQAVAKEICQIKSPCYVRLGKGGEEDVHTSLEEFQIGKAIRLLEGDKACILTTGAIAGEARKAAAALLQQGVSVGLYTFPTVKPIDRKTITDCAMRYRLIVTIEEHNIIGGFGGAVAEAIAELSVRTAVLKRMGLQDVYSSVVGSQDYLRDYYGLSCRKIADFIQTSIDIVNRGNIH